MSGFIQVKKFHQSEKVNYLKALCLNNPEEDAPSCEFFDLVRFKRLTTLTWRNGGGGGGGEGERGETNCLF